MLFAIATEGIKAEGRGSNSPLTITIKNNETKIEPTVGILKESVFIIIIYFTSLLINRVTESRYIWEILF
jgi:hypothetical protein